MADGICKIRQRRLNIALKPLGSVVILLICVNVAGVLSESPVLTTEVGDVTASPNIASTNEEDKSETCHSASDQDSTPCKVDVGLDNAGPGESSETNDENSDEVSDNNGEEKVSSLNDMTNAATEEPRNDQQVFSLTQFLKSWLNPVLQEFQEGLNVGKERSDADTTNNTQPSAPTISNETVAEVVQNKTVDTGKKVKFNCTGRNVTVNTTASVRLVNSSTLLDFLSFDKNNNSTDCVLIMFYAPWCPFCAKTASQFNAVGRAFKQLDVLAVDAIHFSNLNARFGTVAVPNIMVFHKSRSAVRFNQTDRRFNKLVEFVTNVTGLEPNASVIVEELDYFGPLSSEPTVESDYLLWCAWVFVILCTSHMFINSRYGQGVIDKVRTLWQEHQHIE